MIILDTWKNMCHISAMLNSLTLDAKRTPRYRDVLDVLDELGRDQFGSATNAAAQMLREHPLFDRTLRRLRKRKGNSDAQPESDAE
jgi:hypothetical protein